VSDRLFSAILRVSDPFSEYKSVFPLQDHQEKPILYLVRLKDVSQTCGYLLETHL
jgi:hypothetical protein